MKIYRKGKAPAEIVILDLWITKACVGGHSPCIEISVKGEFDFSP
jgi:hypothetical protein